MTAFAFALGLIVFGGIDELTQPWFDRSAEWLDWLADVAGIGLGLVLGKLWLQYRRRRTLGLL
jgi:hypothetical protein